MVGEHSPRWDNNAVNTAGRQCHIGFLSLLQSRLIGRSLAPQRRGMRSDDVWKGPLQLALKLELRCLGFKPAHAFGPRKQVPNPERDQFAEDSTRWARRGWMTRHQNLAFENMVEWACQFRTDCGQKGKKGLFALNVIGSIGTGRHTLEGHAEEGNERCTEVHDPILHVDMSS